MNQEHSLHSPRFSIRSSASHDPRILLIRIIVELASTNYQTSRGTSWTSCAEVGAEGRWEDECRNIHDALNWALH